VSFLVWRNLAMKDTAEVAVQVLKGCMGWWVGGHGQSGLSSSDGGAATSDLLTDQMAERKRGCEGWMATFFFLPFLE
jgi:hypothetical protein